MAGNELTVAKVIVKYSREGKQPSGAIMHNGDSG